MAAEVLGEFETELVVERRSEPADGVVHLVLGTPDGSPLPAWAPGAHVDLLLPDDVARQYSLCGDPEDRSRYEVAVLEERESRGGSRYVCRQLGAGGRVRVRGPRSHFPLVPAEEYVFVAGGIGITPILTMVREAERRGARWSLLYGGRTRSSMAFLDELARYGDRVVVAPQDEVGLLDLPGLLAEPRPGALVYCCGPEPLLLAVERETAHWPAGSLHVERFAPKEVGAPVLSGSFEVHLERTGLTLVVPPEKSILDVVTEAGVPSLSSCGEGTCGTCETPVLEGIPDHRDSLLEDDEKAANDCLMICVSRSCTQRLVLDL